MAFKNKSDNAQSSASRILPKHVSNHDVSQLTWDDKRDILLRRRKQLDDELRRSKNKNAKKLLGYQILDLVQQIRAVNTLYNDFRMRNHFFEDQIKCVKREIGMRKRVYPNLVAGGRMEIPKAEYEIKTMEAVLETLNLMRKDLAAQTEFKL